MRKVLSWIWSVIVTIVLLGGIIFLVLVLYNSNVEESKRIDEAVIKTFLAEKFGIGEVEDDSFDTIDEPVINNELESNYFYSQLDENGKIIYTALDENKENMKTGTYQIKLGTVFTETLKTSKGKDELGDSYQSAIEAYIYDNPDVFYLDVNNMYLNIQKTTKGEKVKYEVFIDNGTNESYLAEGFETKEQIEECEEQIDEIVNKIVSNLSGTNYQKLLKIHDYLVNTIEYDQTLEKDNIYNIYGALINKTCVCEGYAKSFKYLANKIGIDCVIVAGSGTNSSGKQENHAWNYVLLNNNWYAVDVTWDDPIVIGGGTLSDSIKYKYFMKGSKTFFQDHTSDGHFTSDGKEFEYPILSSSDCK
jgi:hypothetical protein